MDPMTIAKAVMEGIKTIKGLGDRNKATMNSAISTKTAGERIFR